MKTLADIENKIRKEVYAILKLRFTWFFNKIPSAFIKAYNTNNYIYVTTRFLEYFYADFDRLLEITTNAETVMEYFNCTKYDVINIIDELLASKGKDFLVNNNSPLAIKLSNKLWLPAFCDLIEVLYSDNDKFLRGVIIDWFEENVPAEVINFEEGDVPPDEEDYDEGFDEFSEKTVDKHKKRLYY